jgi:hypothetical protein
MVLVVQLFAGLVVEGAGEAVVLELDPEEALGLGHAEVGGVVAGEALGFGAGAGDDELGAALGLEPLDVVVVAAEVDVDLAADGVLHELFDALAGDEREGDALEVLVGAGVAVVAVGDVGVVTEGDLPGGGAGGGAVDEPVLLGSELPLIGSVMTWLVSRPQNSACSSLKL